MNETITLNTPLSADFTALIGELTTQLRAMRQILEIRHLVGFHSNCGGGGGGNACCLGDVWWDQCVQPSQGVIDIPDEIQTPQDSSQRRL